MHRKWLVTVAPERVTDVTAALRSLGCQVTPEAAVPVDGDSVVPVSGPDTLEREVANVPGVKALHPDSDLTMY
jgi:hypothetical protein